MLLVQYLCKVILKFVCWLGYHYLPSVVVALDISQCSQIRGYFMEIVLPIPSVLILITYYQGSYNARLSQLAPCS